MKLFIISPVTGDRVTKYATSKWAEKLEDFAKKNSINYISLIGKVTRESINNRLISEKEKSGVICYLSHAEEWEMKGSDGSVLFDEENINLVKNKFIYSISCKSGKCFSYMSLYYGAKAFLGFKDEIYSFTLGSYRDKYNELLGKCFLNGFFAFLKGELSISEIKSNIERNFQSVMDSNKISLEDKKTFRDNKKSLILIGDEKWKWN